jgi:hypothetical protein
LSSSTSKSSGVVDPEGDPAPTGADIPSDGGVGVSPRAPPAEPENEPSPPKDEEPAPPKEEGRTP